LTDSDETSVSRKVLWLKEPMLYDPEYCKRVEETVWNCSTEVTLFL